MNSASVSIWMFWSRSRRSVCRDSRSNRLAMAASRWSPASGDSQDAKAAATMDDLDTPFLAASSSVRWACSGWMKRLRRYWLIGRFRRWGRGSQPGRALHGRVELAGKRQRQVVVIEQRRVVRMCVRLGVVGDGFGEFGLAAWAAVIGAARAIGGCRGRRRRYGRDRQAAPVVGAGWRRVGVPPGYERGRWQDAILEIGVGVVAQLLRADRGDAGHHDHGVIRWKLHHLAGRQQRPCSFLTRHHQVPQPRSEPVAGVVALRAKLGGGAEGF